MNRTRFVEQKGFNDGNACHNDIHIDHIRSVLWFTHRSIYTGIQVEQIDLIQPVVSTYLPSSIIVISYTSDIRMNQSLFSYH